MYNDKGMERTYSVPEGLEPGDSCYGEVTCAIRKGIFIQLEDGTDCFSYDCANLRPGTKVLCTLKRLPHGDRRALLGVDSVLAYAPIPAVA